MNTNNGGNRNGAFEFDGMERRKEELSGRRMRNGLRRWRQIIRFSDGFRQTFCRKPCTIHSEMTDFYKARLPSVYKGQHGFPGRATSMSAFSSSPYAQ